MASMEDVTWNLTELCPSLNDPSVEVTISEAKALADTFEKTYRGKIAQLDPASLLRCLRELEAFDVKIGDVSLFAGLSFAANMTVPETQALYDRVSKLEAELGKQLAFFSLELGALVKAKPELIADPALAELPAHAGACLASRASPAQRGRRAADNREGPVRRAGLGGTAEQVAQHPHVRRHGARAKRRRLATAKPTGCCLILTGQRGNPRTAASTGCSAKTAKSSPQPCAASATTGSRFPNAANTRSPMESSLVSNDTEQAIIDNLLQSN